LKHRQPRHRPEEFSTISRLQSIQVQDDFYPKEAFVDIYTELAMAGIVRQPIDVKSLERYLSQNVPEIKTPIDLKQVRSAPRTTLKNISN
jgi:hypothetical protein